MRPPVRTARRRPRGRPLCPARPPKPGRSEKSSGFAAASAAQCSTASAGRSLRIRSIARLRRAWAAAGCGLDESAVLLDRTRLVAGLQVGVGEIETGVGIFRVSGQPPPPNAEWRRRSRLLQAPRPPRAGRRRQRRQAPARRKQSAGMGAANACAFILPVGGQTHTRGRHRLKLHRPRLSLNPQPVEQSDGLQDVRALPFADNLALDRQIPR